MEKVYKTKGQSREELARSIINPAAYVQKKNELVQRAVKTSLNRARLRTVNRAGHFEQFA
jgi:hypothetical protein